MRLRFEREIDPFGASGGGGDVDALFPEKTTNVPSREGLIIHD